MVQRQNGHAQVVRKNINGPVELLEVGGEVAVGEHGALLAAGGAGGINERGHVVGLRLIAVIGGAVAGGGLAVFFEHLVEVVQLNAAGFAVIQLGLLGAEENDVAQIGAAPGNVQNAHVRRAVHQQHRGAGVGKNVAHFLFLEFDINGHGGRREAGDGIMDGAPFGGVGAQ